MKKVYFILCFLLPSLISSGQYSVDLSAPFKVCQSGATQKNVQAFNKGAGTYVFWLDNRNGLFEVYGQRLDAAGVPQWTANGKMVATASATIQAMRVMPWQSGTLVAWMTLDTVFCKYINSTGNSVWAQPTVVATTGNGVIYMDNSGFNIFPNDSGATITHSIIYTGGSDLFTFNRVDFNGNLRWPVLNFTTGLQGYDYRSASDQQNGFYVLSKGNGLGSTMFIQRYNFQGTAMWPTGLDVTSGTSSIGFGGNISMIADSAANLYVTWDGNAGSVQTAKVTPGGSFSWPFMRSAASSNTAGFPKHCDAKLVNNSLFVSWIENVGSDAFCKMQRIDSAGAIQWLPGGVAVDTANGYYGYTRLALSDSGAVTVFFQGTPSVALTAQRVRSNGTFTWQPDSRLVSAVSGDWASYNDFTAIDDPGGCNIVSWTTFTSADIAAAKICSDGTLVSTPDITSPNASVHVFPNPAADQLQFTGLNDNMQELLLYNGLGMLVAHVQLNGSANETIDLSGLATGVYIYRVTYKDQHQPLNGKILKEK
ncbi:MAG TPA: T9SS type A sorting domain-containing protein [Bacteroidia bacterium]|nr:T9SS type A sorting domain-containing protein [Bacteroidia bacterium]